MPSVFIKTYGCQMNERDSEAVAAQLVAKGYSMTADALTADVILLNTCSVRAKAEDKLYTRLGELRAFGADGRRDPHGQRARGRHGTPHGLRGHRGSPARA